MSSSNSAVPSLSSRAVTEYSKRAVGPLVVSTISLGTVRVGGVVSRDGVDGIDGDVAPPPPPLVSVVLLLLLPGVVVGGVVVVVVVVVDDDDVAPPPPPAVSVVPLVVPVAAVVPAPSDDITVGVGDAVMSTFTGE